ncbi:hypothetical protein SCLCIDRAFT_333809 [Scleroderma citrinum Foug A]|uniref:Uncharacterized protein n=1 Tax=Scleroderma citrinum Foug A TaxID=1036808 RepID=A0A0C2ZQM4_9AGAM|nr:hypothetical protein SCLCIDRAFT_333809 [Scleroderma citrinum Foug A]
MPILKTTCSPGLTRVGVGTRTRSPDLGCGDCRDQVGRSPALYPHDKHNLVSVLSLLHLRRYHL